jgi:gamma-glutamylcyclotransferase (GGCT)/AIG2-like uncharacterized protein YtfP
MSYQTEDTETHYPFFVYGTLRRGQENYMLMRGRTVFEQPASLPEMDLFSLRTYPVMVAGSGTVHGELMTLHPRFYHEMVVELDQLEGASCNVEDLFERRLVSVCLESGANTQAWAYVGRIESLHERGYHVAVPEGNWVAYRERLIRGTRFGRFVLNGNGFQSPAKNESKQKKS